MEAPSERAPRVVLVTAPDADTGRRLARLLVERRIAACANLLTGLVSIYRWQGAVEEEAEVLLVIKTTADRVAALEALLAAEHPYDIPECVALEPASVEDRYLEWLLGETA